MVSRKELKYKQHIKSKLEDVVAGVGYKNPIRGNNEVVHLHDDGVYLSKGGRLKHYTYSEFNQYLCDRIGAESSHLTDYFIPNTTEVRIVGDNQFEYTVQVSSVIEPVMYREEALLGTHKFYKRVKGVQAQPVVAKIVFEVSNNRFKYISSQFTCNGEVLPILTKKSERISEDLIHIKGYTALEDWYTKLRTINLNGDEDIKEMLAQHGRIIGEG